MIQCLCVCVCAQVRVCVCACVRARAYMPLCLCNSVRVCAHVCRGREHLGTRARGHAGTRARTNGNKNACGRAAVINRIGTRTRNGRLAAGVSAHCKRASERE